MIQNQNRPLGSLEILLGLASQAPCVSWQILLCHRPNGEFFFRTFKSTSFLQISQAQPNAPQSHKSIFYLWLSVEHCIF